MKHLARIERLRDRKLAQTRAKLDRCGPRDEDDYGSVLPPDDFHCQLPHQDADGNFYGARAWAENFHYLMENHPIYLDPDDALAGRWMFMLSRMRQLALPSPPPPPRPSHSIIRTSMPNKNATPSRPASAWTPTSLPTTASDCASDGAA